MYTGEEEPKLSSFELAEVFGEQSTHMDILMGNFLQVNEVVGRMHGLLILLSDAAESTHYCCRQFSLPQKKKLWAAFDSYLRTCSIVASSKKTKKSPKDQVFVDAATEAYQACLPGTLSSLSVAFS